MNRREFYPEKPSKALARPTQYGKNINRKNNDFSYEELVQSPWGKLRIFFNGNYRKFIPPYVEDEKTFLKNKHKAETEQKAVQLLLNNSQRSWEDIRKLTEYDEYEIAGSFYFYLSNRYEDNPETVVDNWKNKAEKFVDLFSYLNNSDNNTDLVKYQEIADLIDSFHKAQAKTFFFLSLLPQYLDDYSKIIIESSRGYQNIIRWGSTEYLKTLGFEMQREFKLTRTALKQRVADNLVQELGETENNLRAEISRLENENQELEREIQDIKENSLQEAVYTLAKSLQDEQQQPVLDQLFSLYKKIDKLLENNEGLSTQDTLTCFINLENLFKAFSTLNIQPFPPDTEAILEITGEDLDNNKYNYVSGSQFISKEEVKKVKCVACGWKVREEIVTPAKVEEIEN